MKGEHLNGPYLSSFTPLPLRHRMTFSQNFRSVVSRVNLKRFRCVRHVSIVSLCKKNFSPSPPSSSWRPPLFENTRICLFLPVCWKILNEHQPSTFTIIMRFKPVQNQNLIFVEAQALRFILFCPQQALKLVGMSKSLLERHPHVFFWLYRHIRP